MTTTRRELLYTAGVFSGSLAALRADTQPASKPLRNLGGAPAGFPVRTRIARQQGKPFDFVEYCHGLGLGVVETRLPTSDLDAARQFRAKTEKYGMRSILDFRLPRDESDIPAFDASMKAASEAGVIGLHAAMTGRRYEDFDSFDAFKKNFERCQRTIELAEPILRKYRLRLGIENHKGWRAAEQAAWMKRVSSEWVGVHFDFGNNVSLCEDPMETLRLLRPYTFSTHIKDMAVEPYQDGFLLSEVPLGQGFLNLKGMVRSLQEKDSNMPFDLEMITRDPLRIPVFTDKYWATFNTAESPLPGRDLAWVLGVVNKSGGKPLPVIAGKTPAEQLAIEDANIASSIEFARKELGIT
jgi:sugar phosphate isomerase/epimerase